MAKNRDEQGRFPTGTSGNPAGRPRRIPKYVATARRAMPKVLAAWLKILVGKKSRDADRIKAGELLAAYAYGKPRQAVELTTPPEGLTVNMHGVLRLGPPKTEAEWDAERARATGKNVSTTAIATTDAFDPKAGK